MTRTGRKNRRKKTNSEILSEIQALLGEAVPALHKGIEEIAEGNLSLLGATNRIRQGQD